MGEQIVEFARALADQVGEHLAFFLAVQIGARRGRRQIELRCIAGMLGHVVKPSWLPISGTASRTAGGPVKGLYRAGALRSERPAPGY